MPAPIHQRAVPDHVDIPQLPESMNAWFDVVRRMEGEHTMWGEDYIDIFYVVDGLSAVHALATYRYSGRKGEWLDEAGDEPGQWRKEWIVLASSEGDPFIADISKPEIPVLLAEHGAGEWEPEQVHDTLEEFINEITIEKEDRYDFVPPVAPPRDSSITVLEWGDERDKVIDKLVERFPHLYQPHMFEKKVDTPVVLTRRLTRPNANDVIRIIEVLGGSAEIGEAMEKEERSSK